MRVIDFFDNGVGLYPDNIAFSEGDMRLTYAQAAAQTHKIACAIRAKGYGKGTKIAILAPNSNVAFVALLSVFRAEGIWLPVNARNPVEVNVDLLARFDADLLLYHSTYENDAVIIAKAVPGIHDIVCIDNKSSKKANLSDWTSSADELFSSGLEIPDDIMAIFPTGGTTGKSKGVMISHRNIEAMFANFFAHLNYHDGTHHLVVAPMTHSAGLLGCLHFPRGGTNHIMSKVDPEEIMKAIESDGITHLFLPPTVLYMMLAHANVGKYDYSSLAHFMVGAAPSSFEKLKQAIGIFGPVMTEAFGQAEAPASIAMKAPWDYIDKKGVIIDSRLLSCGRPAVFNSVAIMDDDGTIMPKGSAGEIVVKGPLVTPGYYKNPEETAKVRGFGWHHTGDIGVMDAEGFISIVDRKKDMIITGGFNVFPNEIEQVLAAHAAVQECAVVGVPDEKWGEAVKAIVLLKPNSVATETELIALAKAKLGGVKAPKSVDFVDDLPRSPNGKVLKTELRKAYWHNAARAVN
ncbi:MAG: hypothetical protein CVT83_00570 [Alphaproteobacteria bacterium HGW-Alphaproteobacteria-5]|nr:MAG: hypothetical protein CVT83_00570 [Alphaproteobacteria bacterium HGW-Alphaproteobacteria-5]